MSLTLIIGGARSGKSRHAQDLALKHGGKAPIVYIATAQAGDDEMRDRISRHQQERPSHWLTVEEPLDVAAALAAHGGAEAVIIDCLTFYVTNHLLDGDAAECGGEGWNAGRAEAAVEKLTQSALAVHGEVIIVSNEVGLGLVPDYPLGRVFRDVAGRANQAVAAAADRVVFMVAGIPMFVKGSPI